MSNFFPRLFAILMIVFLMMTSARADEIDNIVSAEMNRQYIPGLSIAVVKDGRAIIERGYGLANVELGAKVSPKTVFQTGSIGKQFVASLVLLLAQEGKINLDGPISTYLPSAPATWGKITVRQLLSHTSGIGRVDQAIDLRRDYTEEELLASAFKVPLLSAPGEALLYSNLGYQILGILCSRVGGKFYGEQLRERLFAPSGMQARIISERDIVPGRAAGYDRVDGLLLNQQWVAPSLNTTGDGSLYVTADDMARWGIALDGNNILNQSIKDTLWTPAHLNNGKAVGYGLGWRVFSDNGRRSVRHRGDWQGFTSHILHFPDDRLTITVLINRSNAQPQVIADNIAAHYIPALKKPPTTPPTAALLSATPIFVRSNLSDWKTRGRLQVVEPSIYQVDVTLTAGMFGFSISSENDAVDFGAAFDEAVTILNSAKKLIHGGDEMFLDIAKPGVYTFRFDARSLSSPILTVTPSTTAGS
ncbi:MAG: hypothetical protein JWM78_1867 [Verrucomicrobiaceae bacterium]|nr:hypothetical protein [Verrucomicrobiaceae bacterium]